MIVLYAFSTLVSSCHLATVIVLSCFWDILCVSQCDFNQGFAFHNLMIGMGWLIWHYLYIT